MMISGNRMAVIVLLAAWSLQAPAQSVKEPVAPQVLSSENKKSPAPESARMTLPVTLVFAGGERLKGQLYLKVRNFTLSGRETVTGRSETIALADVADISIRRWRAREHKKTRYLFVPCDVIITLAGGSVYRCGRMPLPGSIDFGDSPGKKSSFYCTFYDYLEKGVWRNSRSRDRHYPELNPHPRTVVEIIPDRSASREKESDPGMNLIKALMK
jgi:hypothetical protein